ncbi:uncharacterized protein LOC130134860 [Syzygium oleosum]|uniref:uncharacterized protein LOC130134860 n=1 Tax=Syzygium oleosum TaxID=219896 RepID=UPI0024B95177|nr:uncharacterized protein LOC130134860 [Syzygium oleosum]
MGSVDERRDCFLTSRCSIRSRLVAQGASKPVWSIHREERYVLQSLGACDKEGIRAHVQAIETVKLGCGLTLSQVRHRLELLGKELSTPHNKGLYQVVLSQNYPLLYCLPM